MWRGQIEPFSERYKLIIWDMRGHGQSDYPADQGAYSEAATVADMNAALLDAAGAEKAIVGGLSLGGYMSLAFHLAHPGRVEALLIIDTGPGYRQGRAARRWLEPERPTHLPNATRPKACSAWPAAVSRCAPAPTATPRGWRARRVAC